MRSQGTFHSAIRDVEFSHPLEVFPSISLYRQMLLTLQAAPIDRYFGCFQLSPHMSTCSSKHPYPCILAPLFYFLIGMNFPRVEGLDESCFILIQIADYPLEKSYQFTFPLECMNGLVDLQGSQTLTFFSLSFSPFR